MGTLSIAIMIFPFRLIFGKMNDGIMEVMVLQPEAVSA